MSEIGAHSGKSRRTDAVVISIAVIVIGLIVFVIGLWAPWGSALGNAGGLCADRAPWGTPANPPYPGPPGVSPVRSWWPVGVTCEGPDPVTGAHISVKPEGWGPSVVAYTSLILVILSVGMLSIQLKRPKNP